MVALDWVGHGRSFVHEDDQAYRTDELVADFLELYAAFATAQNLLVGHSYGSGLAALLAPRAQQLAPVAGVVLVGAAAVHPSARAAKAIAPLPLWVLNLGRVYHRLGGTNSVSVRQMVGGPDAPGGAPGRRRRWHSRAPA